MALRIRPLDWGTSPDRNEGSSPQKHQSNTPWSAQNGWTPCIVAAETGKLEVVKLLVEKGGSINTATKVRAQGRRNTS